ncbi:hypothetical protein CACET_c11160 [Clostridium aceticum]|uniref:Uncharacterized protein n=1 Tax=Clostridium aceticum TaxID=84022 RepID=A0A0G3W7E7_9CLOT|nr:hypothetical protein CACET_c11160 [Clostridium aceticum]
MILNKKYHNLQSCVGSNTIVNTQLDWRCIAITLGAIIISIVFYYFIHSI